MFQCVGSVSRLRGCDTIDLPTFPQNHSATQSNVTNPGIMGIPCSLRYHDSEMSVKCTGRDEAVANTLAQPGEWNEIGKSGLIGRQMGEAPSDASLGCFRRIRWLLVSFQMCVSVDSKLCFVSCYHVNRAPTLLFLALEKIRGCCETLPPCLEGVFV